MIKRKLKSVDAPTMNTGRRAASTSALKPGSKPGHKTAPKAPAAKAGAKLGGTPSPKPKTQRTPAEQKFDNKRAQVLEGRRNGAKQKEGSKTAKQRYTERLEKWTADNKKEADLAKLKRKCFNENVNTAAANRKALVAHGKKALEIRLAKRKEILAKTKPMFKDGKLVVPKLSKEDRVAKIPAKPVPKNRVRVDAKAMKLVEVQPKPRKPKGHVDAQLSKADKKAKKAHNVTV